MCYSVSGRPNALACFTSVDLQLTFTNFTFVLIFPFFFSFIHTRTSYSKHPSDIVWHLQVIQTFVSGYRFEYLHQALFCIDLSRPSTMRCFIFTGAAVMAFAGLSVAGGQSKSPHIFSSVFWILLAICQSKLLLPSQSFNITLNRLHHLDVFATSCRFCNYVHKHLLSE